VDGEVAIIGPCGVAKSKAIAFNATMKRGVGIFYTFREPRASALGGHSINIRKNELFSGKAELAHRLLGTFSSVRGG
jgi:hypothetical protein